MITRLASAVCALAPGISVSAATIHTASAQNQSGPAPPFAGLPSPKHVQPCGLPPLLPATGPVTTAFAEIHDLWGGTGRDSLRRMTTPVLVSHYAM